MDSQSYFDLLQSDVILNDLHWTEEEQIDLEKNEEKQTDLEGLEEHTPPLTARSSKAKAKKASASKSSVSMKQKNFSNAEDITLMEAYFHANKSEDRGHTLSSLQHHWAIIQEQVNKFCECYSQVLNRNQSGMTRDNKDEATSPYKVVPMKGHLESKRVKKKSQIINRHRNSSA
ncbi:hypothetical protein ZWY2020_020911 [Hordeum vulgare]|nr:hypothetical protein ZWY2020_020911 [Hordeum vulgare]